MNARKNGSENGELITISQACELTNLGSATVRRLAEDSAAARKIGRCFRIKKSKLLNYIDELYSC